MDYDLWMNNIERMLDEIPQLSFTIMSTYNALSVPSYGKFLKDILRLKKKYYRKKYIKYPAIFLDIPYLRYPQHQSVFILTEDFAETIQSHVKFMQNNTRNKFWFLKSYKGFEDVEIERMNRVYEMFLAHPKGDNDPDNKINRKNFYAFVNEHDHRRSTNFLKTFPEMEKFYRHCEGL
jgi:hypothetical protein